MKKTSASVLALLFASTTALKLNEAEANQADNFYDNENGLWRQSLVQRHRKGDDVTAVKGPPEGAIGTNVYEAAMNATEGIPGDRSKSIGPGFIQRRMKVDPISPENYDPWVYKFSKDNLGPYPVYKMDERADPSFSQTKHKHRHHKNPNQAIIGTENIDEEVQDFASKHTTGLSENVHHHKKHHKDIAERGMMEEVHTFASDNTPPLNTRVRSVLPFIPNGSDPSAFQGSGFSEQQHHKKHHKHQKPDIAEREMDEEVYGFSADKVSSVNEIEHSKKAPAMNGKSALTQHKKKAKAKDMGERGYDEEVYDFASGLVSAINGQERSDSPYAYNGVSGWDNDSFAQKKHHKHHKDVAERGMDEEVHGFVADNVIPINTRVRSTLPFIPNGSSPSAFEGSAFNEKKHHKKHHRKPDVAERNMDEEVHGFVKEYTPPLNEWEKTKQPFIPNGSDPSAQDPSFAEEKHHRKHHKKDVAERGMDEEVHGFVWHALPPLNTWVRSDDPFIPNGSDESAFDPSFAEKQHFKKHHKKHHKKDVAERGMDEEVHGFVWHAIPPLNTRVKSEDAFVPNGSDPSAFEGSSFAQKKSADIVDGIYANNNTPPLSEQINSSYPPDANGSAQSLAQNKDIIAEPGWTQERVQPYSSSHLPPLSEQIHSEYPFVPNGSDPSAQPRVLAQNLAQYVTDPINWHATEWGMNIDGRTYNDPVVSALSDRPRKLEYPPPQPNGEANKYESLVQRQKKDIAERGMESDYVYPFTHKMKFVEPTANPWLRPYLPYEANGGLNVYSQVEAAPMKDIANKEVRPDVWVEVHKHVNPIAWGRYREPRDEEEPEKRDWDDGPKPKEEPTPEFKFKKPDEPDEDAKKEKSKADAADNKAKAKEEKSAKDKDAAEPDEEAGNALPAKKEPKKVSEEDAKKEKAEAEAAKKEEEAADKEEKEKADAKADAEAAKKDESKKAALAQVATSSNATKQTVVAKKANGDKKADGEKKDGDDAVAPTPEPEKVHVLEPVEYKEKADTNTPNIRTTFYAEKKNTKKAQK